MQSQTGVATWARGLEKGLMIDRCKFTCGSALLKDGKPSSCSFWAPARLDGEPKKTSDRNFWPAREPNTLQLLQTQSFGKELHKYQAERPCSLTFASRWRGGCFPLRFESQRGTASHGVRHKRQKLAHKFQLSGKREMTKVHLGLLHTCSISKQSRAIELCFIWPQ